MKHSTLLLVSMMAMLITGACRKDAALPLVDPAGRCRHFASDLLPEVIMISDHQTGLPVEKEFLEYDGNLLAKETILKYSSEGEDTTFVKFTQTSGETECLVYYGGIKSFWQQRNLYSYADGKLVSKVFDGLQRMRNAALTYDRGRLVGFTSRLGAEGMGGYHEDVIALQYKRQKVEAMSWTSNIYISPYGLTTVTDQYTFPCNNAERFTKLDSHSNLLYEKRSFDQVLSPYRHVGRPETVFQLRFHPTYFGSLPSFNNDGILADLVDGGPNGLNSRLPSEVKYWNDGILSARYTYSVKRINRQHLPTEFQITDMNGSVSDVRIRYTHTDEE